MLKELSMYRLSVLLALALASLPVCALDLTLLVGHQFNADVEISTLQDNPQSISSLDEEKTRDVDMKDGTVYSAALDFVFEHNPNQRIGLFVSTQEMRFDQIEGLTDDDVRVSHVHFTAMNYYPSGRMEPFVLAGIGAGFFSPQDSSLSDETRVSAQIGAGTNYKVTENILLRLELRWIPTFFNSDSEVFCDGGCNIKVKSDVYSQTQVNLGLMFRL